MKKERNTKLPNKYYIIKSVRPDYLILITDKTRFGLTSYGCDEILLNYLIINYLGGRYKKRVELYKTLNSLGINYLILDGIEETYIHSFDDNQYGDVLYTAILNYLI